MILSYNTENRVQDAGYNYMIIIINCCYNYNEDNYINHLNFKYVGMILISRRSEFNYTNFDTQMPCLLNLLKYGRGDWTQKQDMQLIERKC